jgi:hypothetical protein
VRGLRWRGEVAVVVVRVGGEDGGSRGRLAGRVERTVAMAGRGGDDGDAGPTLGRMLFPPYLFFYLFLLRFPLFF